MCFLPHSLWLFASAHPSTFPRLTLFFSLSTSSPPPLTSPLREYAQFFTSIAVLFVRFVSSNYSRSRLSCRVLVSFVSGIRQIFHSAFTFRNICVMSPFSMFCSLVGFFFLLFYSPIFSHVILWLPHCLPLLSKCALIYTWAEHFVCVFVLQVQFMLSEWVWCLVGSLGRKHIACFDFRPTHRHTHTKQQQQQQ